MSSTINLWALLEGEAISPEDFVELRKMRQPRPADYVVQNPELKDMCAECGDPYFMELAVIRTWNPITISCPNCYGITIS